MCVHMNALGGVVHVSHLREVATLHYVNSWLSSNKKIKGVRDRMTMRFSVIRNTLVAVPTPMLTSHITVIRNTHLSETFLLQRAKTVVGRLTVI